MGLWHGTAPRYLAYGLYHACLLSAHSAWVHRRSRNAPAPDTPLGRLGGRLLTLNLVCVGFLIFWGLLG